MKKILVIDDEEKIRNVISRYLQHDGYSVVAVADAKQAMQAVQDHFFHLVITDILLPEKNGIELIADLDKEVPGLKFIAISGGGHIPADLYLESARSQGAAVSLTKPFDRSDLLDAVESLIGEPVTI
jgi:DNA-binding NtrC family response regulator